MSSGVYGGDEVGALVLDPGHFSFRVGYAGEDSPKAEIPSFVGILDVLDDAATNIRDSEEPMEQSDENKPPTTTNGAAAEKRAHPSRKYFIDTNSLHVPRKGVELSTFLKDGMIENWELFEQLLDYAYKRHLMTPSDLHPVLMSEPPWNPKAKRERLTELMFETYNIPAFFLCKTAVLSAFANGRSTALVLDSGATHTSAIPVYDGYCLQHIARSPLGADAITAWCQQYLQEEHVEIIPPYMIAAKEPVGDQDPPRWTRKAHLPEVTKTFHDYMVKEVIRDFQATVLQVCDTPFDAEHCEKWPALQYEFPNGYHRDFVGERLRIPEGLFDPSVVKYAMQQPPVTSGIGQLVTASVNACDVDMRSSLYNNIVVTGGNSLLQGFVERLTHDVQQRCPSSMKTKIYSAVGSAERRFGPWIGGSILASLGSFQQMWISKQEYEESGKSIVEKKCP